MRVCVQFPEKNHYAYCRLCEETYLFALVGSRFGVRETSLVFAGSFESPLEAGVCSTRRPVRLVDAIP